MAARCRAGAARNARSPGTEARSRARVAEPPGRVAAGPARRSRKAAPGVPPAPLVPGTFLAAEPASPRFALPDAPRALPLRPKGGTSPEAWGSAGLTQKRSDEDDVALAGQLRQALEAAGFAVDVEHDGEAASFAGTAEAYSAAVLDLGLLCDERVDATPPNGELFGAGFASPDSQRAGLARRLLGWEHEVAWERALRDVLADWRARVARG